MIYGLYDLDDLDKYNIICPMRDVVKERMYETPPSAHRSDKREAGAKTPSIKRHMNGAEIAELT